MEWGMDRRTRLAQCSSQRDWIKLGREMAAVACTQSQKASDAKTRAFYEELARQWTLFAEAAGVEISLSHAA